MNSRKLVALPLLWFAISCAKEPQLDVHPPAKPGTPAKKELALPPRKTNTTLIGRIPEGTVGPHRFTRDEYDLVVWASSAAVDGGVFVRDLRSGVKNERLSDAPSGLRFMSTLAEAERVSLLFSHRNESTHYLTLTELGAKTLALSPRRVVAQSPSPILWSEVLPLQDGRLVVWAERGAKGADLYACAERGGKLTEPRRIVRGALSWEVEEAWGKVLLLTYEGDKKKRSLVMRLLNHSAELDQKERVLSDKLEVLDEIEVSVGKTGALVSVTEKTPTTSRVMTLSLDSRLSPRGSWAPLTRPRGEQRLLRSLVSPSGDLRALAWEEPRHEATGQRQVLLSLVDELGKATGEIVELTSNRSVVGVPEMQLTDDGSLGFLTQDPDDALRYVVGRGSFRREFSEAFELSAPEGTLGLVWDATFRTSEPTGLLATAEPSPLVYAFQGAPPGAKPRTLSRFLEHEALPRVLTEQKLGLVPELSKLTGIVRERDLVVSWLSYFDPSVPPSVKEPKAPDGRAAPMRAWVKSQTFQLSEETGEIAQSGETVISYRARSLGGLGVAPSAAGYVLGWSAIDGNDPGLFLTQMDALGKKKEQKMLRHSPGEVTDIAVAPVADGYWVSWVDGRASLPDLFVQKVDERLRPQTKELQLTEGLNDPSDLALVATGDGLLLVYAERPSPKDSTSDLFIQALSLSGEKRGLPHRVGVTPEHSFAPIWVKAEGTGALSLVWLEAAEGQNESSRVLMANVAPDGRLTSDANALVVPGSVRSFDLKRVGAQTRAVFLVEREGRGELWGALLGSGAAPQRLTILDGPPSQTVAPVLASDFVLYFDQKPGGAGELSALKLAFE